ncbi:hypothetical protein ACFQ88_31895 [Paenibacillus sp. NPDC056579]|uniref:hypothetical protein n=1 Tax=unclassified Paenibacillus TaxID=185978 RepID=UPI001EF7BC2E|nr:hypothetical protein [Paenibacillus sp. H1-7]
MTNRKSLRLVLATFLMFGTTVALYEWNQSVSDQQAQSTGSANHSSTVQSTGKPSD